MFCFENIETTSNEKRNIFRVTNASGSDAWKKAKQATPHYITPPTMKMSKNFSFLLFKTSKFFFARISEVRTLLRSTPQHLSDV